MRMEVDRYRNFLFSPGYFRYVEDGGPDYRTLARRYMLSAVARAGGLDISGVIMPNIRGFFPRSMGNVIDTCARGICNIVNNSVPTVEPIILAQGITGGGIGQGVVAPDLVLDSGSESALLFLDIFPEDNPWFSTERERGLLLSILPEVRDTVQAALDQGSRNVKATAGVLMTYMPAYKKAIAGRALDAIENANSLMEDPASLENPVVIKALKKEGLWIG